MNRHCNDHGEGWLIDPGKRHSLAPLESCSAREGLREEASFLQDDKGAVGA